jgi:glycosyltransferase involved in cell wall biosynthesis
MSTQPTIATEGPGIFYFAMPFAAPGNFKHAEQLLDCLAPNCRLLMVVGDQRIDLSGRPAHVMRHSAIPTLHYLSGMRPWFWSATLWVLKLIWIILRASWALLETRRRVDVVVCYKGAYYAPMLALARALGKKTIAFLPNSDTDVARNTYGGHRGGHLVVGALRLLEGLNRKLADICVVQSFYLVEELGLRSCPQKVRLGIVPLDINRYTNTIPIQERPLVVGFVGRLSPIKGVMPLIAAAAAMRDSGVTFQIVGDGPLRQEVEAALQQPELTHVELVGWVSGEALAQRLNSFRLMVLPTSNEGVPNALKEAMACGTPVLAPAVGGIPDLIQHGVTGFTLLEIEPAVIEQSIRAALDHPDLAGIAERGSQHIAYNYSLAAAVRKWRNILDELVADTAAKGAIAR